ncbi:MAG: 23S rRNA (adenine(2503)-C(2))-methyltransferase RlmN [Candidatus Marinimicrobia bacterium]|nr:23S rRNA (adenine(2503)-C(2))-methyltransferase RlmN [Candidatus Neomarinimicrobiota bacterium]
MLSISDKFIIKGKDLSELQHWCKEKGHPKFRAQQLFEWMYFHGESNPEAMSNLSKNLISDLSNDCILQTLAVEKVSASENESTNKFLFKTMDNRFIETVSMVEDGRHTVCISSQIGCSVDCDFCATASMGIIRNLNTGEIIDQLSFIRAKIETSITNIVFMGMGEPFLNYERVLKAADIFHDPKGFGLGAHRITISTAGILPKINKFYEEGRKYKLAISLNASNDVTRSKIMPINNKWPIADLVAIGRKHAHRNRKVMFEYVLLDGVNDSVENARELAKLLRGVDCKLNVIPYNETDGKYGRPENEAIESFLEVLSANQKGYRVMVRWSKGQDIDAGCGQLAVKQESHE